MITIYMCSSVGMACSSDIGPGSVPRREFVMLTNTNLEQIYHCIISTISLAQSFC